tara:strand:+ start:28 stop:522 length:495 start_codon:yes stop_codon:yes gene_type:complete
MNRARPPNVTNLRELAFDAGSPYIVVSNMLHTVPCVAILGKAKEEISMGAVKQGVIEREQRGEISFNEEKKRYELGDKKERGHESSPDGGVASDDTVGRHVCEGRIRHSGVGVWISEQVECGSQLLPALAGSATGRDRQRVFHWQARGRQRLLCEGLLQAWACA